MKIPDLFRHWHTDLVPSAFRKVWQKSTHSLTLAKCPGSSLKYLSHEGTFGLIAAISEWVISKFNGTSTPKGSYSAKTGDNDRNVHSNRYSLRTALCESIRYQAKSEQNVRQDLIPRCATGRLLSYPRYWHKRSEIKRYISRFQANDNLLFNDLWEIGDSASNIYSKIMASYKEQK